VNELQGQLHSNVLRMLTSALRADQAAVAAQE
jgi:hypothetical protein